jgi:cytochrome c biogenesis protein CcmG, thiol:disulfide interchange protein DsbE
MRSRWVWLPLALLAFVAGLSVYGLLRPKDDFVHSNMVGQKLPAFDLPAATDGVSGLRNIDFADGTPRLLNIFASWCIPCRAEAPYLDALKARGAQIYGVAIRDDPRDVAAFLNQYGNPFAKIASDATMKLQLSLGSSGVPETYVIGGDGTILYQHIGDIRAEHVPQLLAKLEEAK